MSCLQHYCGWLWQGDRSDALCCGVVVMHRWVQLGPTDGPQSTGKNISVVFLCMACSLGQHWMMDCLAGRPLSAVLVCVCCASLISVACHYTSVLWIV
jgi:hypothetical protein